MEEPSPRSSRLALAGAFLAITMVGGTGFLIGRSTTERTQVVIAPAPAAPASKPKPPPVLDAVLGRADLMALAAAAADASAGGRDPAAEIDGAAGRRFEIRLPFGCDGPAREGTSAAAQWRYEPDDQTLRIRVVPISWEPQDWWGGDSALGVEAIEGFWITRPWTSSEACPEAGDRPSAPGTEPVTLPGQTLAVGQVFFVEGARGGRRNGEPYTTAVRVAEEELDVSLGFRLRISGRIAPTRGIGPVRCRQPAGPEQRPICLVSVEIDEVAIENPAKEEILATWSLGGINRPEV